MIKFRCNGCQKKMGVPDDYAGKRVRCPQCQQPVTVPVNAPSPPPPSVSSPVERSETNPVPLEAFGELSPQDEDNRLIWTDDLLKPTSPPPSLPSMSPAGTSPPTPSLRKCPKCGTEVTGTVNICNICGCFVGGVNRGVIESDEKPKRTFWQDLLYLISPIHCIGDAIRLFFLLIITVLMNVTLYLMSFMMLIGLITICGYWCAYMFSVVVETAGGEDELPDFPGIMSFWEDLLHPLLLWVASFIYAFLPMIIMMIYYEINGLDSGDDTYGPKELTVIIGLGGVGMFFWPMILLGLSLGESLGSVRPDLVLQSIAKTILPYLMCCLCLYGCVFLWYLSYLAMVGAHGGSLGGWILVSIAGKIGSLCLWLYAMRTMGLLYRHYQHRLVW
ncbi:MAG: DUF4013 domain-containing protein [Sedimentisphaerales bacterium]|nr:DUF4013 domain-containing protein [Sedimentisphaerales bacterium]